MIKETLRLASAGPCNFREAKQDIKYEGCGCAEFVEIIVGSGGSNNTLLIQSYSNADYVIPKGWDVLVFLVGTHLDGKYHSQPLKFDPWRWEHEGALVNS